MGVLLRLNLALPSSATARLLPYVAHFTTPSNWNFYSTTVVLLTAGSRDIRSIGKPSCGEQENQLVKDCFSIPSEWRDNRLGKRNLRYPPRYNRTRELAPGLEELRLWTSRLQRLCLAGELDRALDDVLHNNQQGFVPSVNLYISLLKECAKRKALVQAKRVHAHLAQHGLESSKSLAKSVVGALVKCGGLDYALEVFHRLPQRTVSSWTAVIFGFSMNGQAHKALKMYEWMQVEGVRPNAYTFVSLLKACGSLGDLGEAKRFHAETMTYRCESELFVRTCLIDVYGKCGSIVDAQNVFDGMSERDVVSWTAMLAAYVLHGQAGKALQLYVQMQEEGMTPNGHTWVSVLQACSLLAEEEDEVAADGEFSKFRSLGKGRAIHADAWEKGYDLDIFVGSTLISMYGKCGNIVLAKNVFDKMSEHDLVVWNSMLAAYVQQGLAVKALQLYEEMQEAGVGADDWTFVSVLQACGILADKEDEVLADERFTKLLSLEKGKAVHAAAWRKGYDSDVFVGSTLITLYGKCGSIEDAQQVFNQLPQQNVVSYNTMLVAYAQQGQGGQALQLYRQMQEKGALADDITFLSVLQVCSNTGSLDICRQIHRAIHPSSNSLIPRMANALIHAYSKCASMVDAQLVFDALPQPDVVSWNALIAGYARQGTFEIGLQCFEDMRLQGTKPDGITFLSLLCICSHAGLMEKGVEYFEVMSRDHGITPQIEHYGSMVDLLGRAGHFRRIEDLLLAMPVKPDLAIWLCLLGACQKHGKVGLGKHAFERAVHLQPNIAAAYLLMSNIYADAGLWDYANEVRKLRGKEDAWKKPGQSWMEHGLAVETFLVADRKHPHEADIYDLLDKVRLNDTHISAV